MNKHLMIFLAFSLFCQSNFALANNTVTNSTEYELKSKLDESQIEISVLSHKKWGISKTQAQQLISAYRARYKMAHTANEKAQRAYAYLHEIAKHTAFEVGYTYKNNNLGKKCCMWQYL